MPFDPTTLDLKALFTNASMLDSRDSWRARGFTVVTPAKPTECMVASHPSVPGLLFKKYARDNLSTKEQNANYATRIEGAEKLSRFIAKKGLNRITVPRKCLRELPKPFSKDTRILIVERLDILSPDESVRAYRTIAKPLLQEVMAVIAEFEGLDSNAKNLPFLKDGRVAFVDLEHWNRRKKSRLKVLGSYLSKENLHLARKLIDA